ncbi:MAG: DNA translocase FtsK 4TM domain-containing protein, partial [Candidatus Caldatribacteriota bacterium]|nr:DNA translocase FtsK 4TM domain-containing protein [Candidatus Caldatribacteriota bacterium]
MKKGKEMVKAPSDHPIRTEIWGVIFLLITLIFGVSLLSYYPQDPLLWETGQKIVDEHNMFGSVGANLSGLLFLLCGFSSFWLIAGCLFLSFSFFRDRLPS